MKTTLSFRLCHNPFLSLRAEGEAIPRLLRSLWSLAMTLWTIPIVLLCLFLLIGCASSKNLLKNSETQEGERLYKIKCASCHRLFPPAKHTKEQWKEYVEKYGSKIHLTQDEKNKILEYLTTTIIK